MTFARPMYSAFRLALMVLCFAAVAVAQTETATISGLITDDTGAVVPGAEVKLQSVDRGTVESATTNNAGIYVFASVHPGQYQLAVHKQGFKQVDFLGLIVNVQDHIEQNFRLQIGSVSESVTVEASAATINTTDATVSTVVDRQFAENLPLNGRSFQTLIQLAPGVVVTPTNSNDNGQFSVNGERPAANYWMVDGVSANIGIGVNLDGSSGNGLGGTLGSFSTMGGTNSLVSVDALQEFRIQTSTYAPEFGRTPGAQISIATRSGTNAFHGALFDYLRNDAFDANDWFAIRDGLPKPEERQNDFGGTLGGPILKNRTFFFVSYEGLRLRLPQVNQEEVPDLIARQNAIVAMQPYLDVFPLPTPGAPDNLSEGIAQFRASYSDKSTLDAGSIRIDHKVNEKVSLFGRYDYSPSAVVQRGGSSSSLNTINPINITTETATAGATWSISSAASNDLRFNYSRATASGSFNIDGFGGGVPLASVPFPTSVTSQNGLFWFEIYSAGTYYIGKESDNLQQQINLVESFSLQKGSHTAKFGVDFRRLSPRNGAYDYRQVAAFLDVPLAENGNLLEGIINSNISPTFLFRNLGAYAQDTWRVLPRLTVTYGLRWDIDFVPQSLSGPSFPAAVGFNLNDISNLAVAPPGTEPYATTYGNLAPRVGVAYQLRQNQNVQTVLRGGFGIFYDLATSEAGNSVITGLYPFGGSAYSFGTFPLANTAPVPISPPSSSNPGAIALFDPHLKLPYTLQWNVSLEQALGPQQTISASYIGAAGKRLLLSALIEAPTESLSEAQLTTNAGTSDYDALQVQFQRRLSHGLQVLASYTWSHSIDTGSAGSLGVVSNDLVPADLAASNRGPSDFDIRHAFTAGTTYEIPTLKRNALTNAFTSGWSLDNVIQVRSAPPVDVSDEEFSNFTNGVYADIRPDLVPGQPLYLYGANCASVMQAIGTLSPGEGCPGGKGINPNAFTDPPFDPTTGLPLRQGNVPRNFLRAFGATQWDFAVHRDFPIHESLKLQFRAEMFNVLNHPNFGPPNTAFLSPQFGGPVPGFGVAGQMLGRSLGGFGSTGSGGFSSLYQLGGPRSIQLALKLTF